MRNRPVGLLDVGVLALTLVAVLLPAREMFAMEADRGKPEQRFAVALAEARSIAHPADAVASVAFAHRLREAGFRDWAVEEAVRGSSRAEGTPQRWRILFAAGEAYLDQYEAVKGLDYASRALGVCDGTDAGCPEWEQARMKAYVQQLEAAVKSGIDPRKEPTKFREAGERALHGVRITGHEAELQPGAPSAGSAGSAGSGSAGSSAP